jgi:membrane associated rhomboid family serine protease
MILFGLLFTALGIVSCIIPDILVLPLTVLVGVLNILSGVITLIKTCIPRLKKSDKRSPDPPIMVRLFVTQLTMSLLSILFGTSMLVSGLIPGLVIGIILFANGCTLLYLLHVLTVLDEMQSEMVGAAAS